MQGFHSQLLDAGRRMPLLVRPTRGRSPSDIAPFRAALRDLLLQHGALLFRDFEIRNVQDFAGVLDAFGGQRLDYTNRSTPRTALAERVFTATEYPAHQTIPLHCENAYQRSWPMRVAFCCLKAAASGGETPIADMDAVTAAVGAACLEKFRSRKVRYVRHYHPYVDLPWQTTFQTEDRAEVSRYCDRNGIEHAWLQGDVLRTEQVAQGVARHPRTGREVLFNQAHLFHPSSLGAALSADMCKLFGPGRLPRDARHGDGSEIAIEDLESVRDALASNEVSFRWQTGDILLLDNMQVAHGRRPFSGHREVVVALLDSHEPEHD